MEQKQFFCGDQLPPISTKYPWLVAHKLIAEEDATEDQVFYTINDPLSQYRCQIPELIGKYILGSLHGWVILVDYPHQVMWSVWNPVTSEIIHLPPLILKNGKCEVIDGWCLSHPPDHPSSILSLTRYDDHTIVFCRLADNKENRFTWMETSYIEQLKSISYDDVDDYKCFLNSLTCCNGKVYAYSNTMSAIEVNIVVNDTEVVMSLLPFGELPSPPLARYSSYYHFLEGYGTDLFFIVIALDKVTEKPLVVYLYKMNTTSMMWNEMEDLKDAIFFIELGDGKASIFYMPDIASELGGYIHIRARMDKVMYFYNVKDKTISISSMPCLFPERYVSLWDCRLPGDHGDIISKPENKKDEIVLSYMDHKVDIYDRSTRQTLHVEDNESCLLNIPFDVLALIMEFCGGVEYLNFRATCKSCLLAAPVIQWNNGNKHRLQTYSLDSPWLLVFNKFTGIITFTDPVFDDNYFIKTPQKLIGDLRIHCSKYGWLLVEKYEIPESPETNFVFFINPFTSDIHELPQVPNYVDSFCFSTPPTSPNCIVVGFGYFLPGVWRVYIHFVARKPYYWLIIPIDSILDDVFSLCFPAFYDGDVYALLKDGGLVVLKEIEQTNVSSSLVVLTKAPKSCHGSSTKYFLVKCYQQFLLVTMGKFGQSLQVFKFNDLTMEWEEINSLERHMIIISDKTCLCIEAKMREMENRIYFSRLHSESEKIVSYSLETGRYHTFKDKNIEDSFENFLGTKYHLYPNTWIEPSWS